MDAVTVLLWIAVIQFVVGPVLLLVVGRMLKRRVDRVEEQLTNSHDTNIRDEITSKFDLVFAKINHGNALQKKQGRVLVAMRRDIAELFENDADQLADVQALREEIAKKSP